MEERNQKGWGFRWVYILLIAILIGGLFWGVSSLMKLLSTYGQSSIAQDPEEPEQQLMETITPENDIPKNEYDPHGFSQINGIKTYEADGVVGIAGIDVSSHQPSVDWAAVKEAGIEFAMIRVGYRGYETGLLALDERFHEYMQGALDQGLAVGVYFFSQALTPEEAEEEANFVIEQIEDYSITCPVVFDWEEVSGPARTDAMNMLLLTECAQRFCETVKAAGYRPAVYFNQAYGYQQLNLSSLKDYDFWLAEYDDAPSFYYDFQMWQYTNEGSVPGIEGPVDLNIWFHD